MIVSLKEFSNTIAKISALVAGDKTIPGVMFRITDDSLHVCYHDGHKAFIEKVDAKIEESDVKGDIVVNYERLVDVVDACQPTGNLIVDNLEISFKNDDVMVIKAEKKIAEYESVDAEPEYRTYSVFEQSLKWMKADASIKVAILARMNYDSIFNADEVDDWETSEFKEVLGKISSEKNRRFYVSPKKGIAFVTNLAYLSCIPLKSEHSEPVVLTTNMAKSVADLLNKLDSSQDLLHIHTIDRKFCCIYTDDKKVGIMVEMSPVAQVDLTTLSTFRESKKYRNYQFTFVREVLKNVVDAAISAGNTDKTVLTFGKSEVGDETELRIVSQNSIASINNKYVVICVEVIGEDSEIEKLELPVSLKVLEEMLDKCQGDYVALDVDIDDNGVKCIRVAEIDMEKRKGVEGEIRARLGLGDNDVIPIEERINSRHEILGITHYAVSAK